MTFVIVNSLVSFPAVFRKLTLRNSENKGGMGRKAQFAAHTGVWQFLTRVVLHISQVCPDEVVFGEQVNEFPGLRSHSSRGRTTSSSMMWRHPVH